MLQFVCLFCWWCSDIYNMEYRHCRCCKYTQPTICFLICIKFNSSLFTNSWPHTPGSNEVTYMFGSFLFACIVFEWHSVVLIVIYSKTTLNLFINSYLFIYLFILLIIHWSAYRDAKFKMANEIKRRFRHVICLPWCQIQDGGAMSCIVWLRLSQVYIVWVCYIKHCM